MPYGSASGVANYCRNLLGQEPTWSTSTCPTKKQIDHFMSAGCAVLETHLTARGYTVPVASATGAYGWIVELNELWGAAHAEFHRTNVTLAPGERTRGQYFYEMFWEQLDRLSKLDLTKVGVTRGSAGRIYVGGISRSEKQTIEDNTDLLSPRFFRGQFRTPNTIQPEPATAS